MRVFSLFIKKKNDHPSSLGFNSSWDDPASPTTPALTSACEEDSTLSISSLQQPMTEPILHREPKSSINAFKTSYNRIGILTFPLSIKKRNAKHTSYISFIGKKILFSFASTTHSIIRYSFVYCKISNKSVKMENNNSNSGEEKK